MPLGRSLQILWEYHVRDSVEELSQITGCLCSIRAHIDDEILVMDHLGTSTLPVHEHVGDRYPFAPPFGLSFVIFFMLLRFTGRGRAGAQGGP